jgi:hypothetical protein
MKTLEEYALEYADQTIGFDKKNHWEWKDVQVHIIRFCKESKWIEMEKLKAKIEEIDTIISCYNLSKYQDEDLRLKMNRLEQQLKHLEDENN